MRVMKVKYYDLDQTTGNVNRYMELTGDSTEAKPTANIIDGSTFLETDTGDLYIYNEHSTAWVKFMTLKE